MTSFTVAAAEFLDVDDLAWQLLTVIGGECLNCLIRKYICLIIVVIRHSELGVLRISWY